MLDRYKRPQETIDGLRDRLHEIAMLGLQSERYGVDMDFRDVVDDALYAYRATVAKANAIETIERRSQ